MTGGEGASGIRTWRGLGRICHTAALTKSFAMFSQRHQICIILNSALAAVQRNAMISQRLVNGVLAIRLPSMGWLHVSWPIQRALRHTCRHPRSPS